MTIVELETNIRKKAYIYAETTYNNWYESFCEDMHNDSDSWYKNSLDAKMHPLQDYLEEQLYENLWQCILDEGDIIVNTVFEMNLSNEELKLLKKVDLFGTIMDGVYSFTSLKYNAN